MRLPTICNLLAAGTAVFLSCASPPADDGTYTVIRYRGVTVGAIRRLELGRREDASGPFLLTTYRLRFRRWADGRGAVIDELAAWAARRPGRPIHYAAGRWDGGEFRYRAGTSWRLKVVDEFGNVVERRGAEAPSLLTFRGVPLPGATSPRPAGSPRLVTLELTSGRATRYRGGGRASGLWVGRGDAGDAAVTFDARGAVVAFADEAGLVTAPAPKRPRLEGVYCRRAEPILLPLIIPPRPETLRLRLPVSAELSGAAEAEDLASPGQDFEGLMAGNRVRGVFGLEPGDLPPLAEAAPPFASCGRAPLAIRSGGVELERLAAFYRAEGKTVRFATGLGLFAGNVVSRYEWLEVDGRAVAAPGRPRPRIRLALRVGDEPWEVVKFALTGEPEIEGGPAAPRAPGVPGLAPGADLHYRIYHRGETVGEIVARYEAPPGEPPAVFLYGDIYGRPLEAAAAAPAGNGAFITLRGGRLPWADFVLLGAAVSSPSEEGKPPYEFYFESGAGGRYLARWSGIKSIVAGGDVRPCRFFRVEPGPLNAFYTYDGVLTRLEGGGFSARLVTFPSPAKLFSARPEPGGEPPAPPPDPPTPAEGPEEAE